MVDIRDAMEELALILSHRSSLDSLKILAIAPPTSNTATLDTKPGSFNAQIIPYPSKKKQAG